MSLRSLQHRFWTVFSGPPSGPALHAVHLCLCLFTIGHRTRDTCDPPLHCNRHAHRCVSSGFRAFQDRHGCKLPARAASMPALCLNAADCRYDEYCPRESGNDHHGECARQRVLGDLCKGGQSSELGRQCADGMWCHEGACRKRCTDSEACGTSQSCERLRMQMAVCMPTFALHPPRQTHNPKPLASPPALRSSVETLSLWNRAWRLFDTAWLLTTILAVLLAIVVLLVVVFALCRRAKPRHASSLSPESSRPELHVAQPPLVGPAMQPPAYDDLHRPASSRSDTKQSASERACA